MSESISTKLEPTMTKVESLVTNLRKKAQVYRCVGIYEMEQELLDVAATIEGLECENRRLRELVDYMTPIAWYEASEREHDSMRELGVEVDV